VGKTVLDMSMSVDGFIAGPNVAPGNGLGDRGPRLHEWFLPDGDAGHRTGRGLTGVNRAAVNEVMATGAVLVGRRTFDLAGGWDGDHHDGVPIFVLSRRPPDPPPWRGVTYVGDIAALAWCAAAGDRDVLVHGARTARLALAAGVLDELRLHLIPVLLGRGELLFEDLDLVELELLAAVDGPGVTHLRYRVRAEG
jgi:dihydrofolate reductase